ncbi:response regulator transcription factor [Methylophaga lonarensis]|uniref:response regulator transcription factor n=1 Tax=Methylophaga lonarensis TaxID=999151 RepID=UPI003D2768DE
MKIHAIIHPENSPLTKKENEVLARLAEGRTRQEVADELHRSFQTVNTHVHHILTKLDASTSVQAVAIAVLRQMLSFQRALCLCLVVCCSGLSVLPGAAYAGDLTGTDDERPFVRYAPRVRPARGGRVRNGRRR